MKFDFHIRPKKIGLKDIKKEKKEKHYTKQIIMFIMIIRIFTTFFSGVSFGKAIHNANIKNSTEIAKPILEVEKNSEIMITEDNKRGEYQFIVKNYNKLEEISEVDLKYYIEILEANLDKSICYSLYKESEEMKLNDNKTEEIKLNKDRKEEQIYTLKVEYDSTKNNIGDIMQDIQIKIHSEQLKI